ncbi:MAG TPA: hypothetical protein DCS55_02800, partial [Acidimicrobiaceae bacterium]|nr:hypothetical protein [Acidimicrobiaceae bacterium]
AGADRYATSVAMAETFGGWFATGDGGDHDASMVCLAASSGGGAASVGWPDALGAGPWCAAAGGLATATPAPARGLPPVSGPHPRTTRAGTPSHDAVPVLLTPVNATDLAGSVADFLGGTFDPAEAWCSSVQASDTCLDPGFVVAFGGPAVVTGAALRQAARAVSGETYVVYEDQVPTAQPSFWTELDLRPVYAQGGAADEVTLGRACAARGALRGVRWLAAYLDASADVFGAADDVFGAGRYVRDHDGTARTPGESAPACVQVPETGSTTVNAVGVSVSGNVADAGIFDVSEDRRFELSQPIEQTGAEVFEGTDATIDDDGTISRWTFADDGLTGTVATSEGESAAVTAASVDIRLRRGGGSEDPDT